MALWSSQLNRPGFEPRLLTCKRVREIYIPGNHPSPPDLTPVLCDVSRRKRKKFRASSHLLIRIPTVLCQLFFCLLSGLMFNSMLKLTRELVGRADPIVGPRFEFRCCRFGQDVSVVRNPVMAKKVWICT